MDDLVSELKKISKPSSPSAAHRINIRQINEFKILKATYGTTKNTIDVTKQLSDKIINNRLSITANNKIAGDPDKGVFKTMRITYVINGEQKQSVFKENSIIKLP